MRSLNLVANVRICEAQCSGGCEDTHLRAISWFPAWEWVIAIWDAMKSDWRDVLCALKYSYAFV